MIKRFALLLMLLGLICILAAETDNNKVGLGLHFGSISGNGYAMRWMGEDLGLQITLGAMTSGSNKVRFDSYYYPDEDETASTITVEKKGRDRSLNSAINLIFMLDRFRSGRLYLAGGVSYTNYKKHVVRMNYQRTSSYNYTLVEGSRQEEDVLENRWVAGIGPGLDIGISHHFRIAFEVPVTYDYKDNIIMYIPQVGFYYFFK